MPRLTTIFFAGLLAATAARADTVWHFDLHLDPDYQPAGKISVVLDGAAYLVTDKPLGGYRTIEPTDYHNRQIPAAAAVACRGSWGDHIEELYVQVEPVRLLAYRREFIETDPPPPFTLFKTIPLKSGVEMPEPISRPTPPIEPWPMAVTPAVTTSTVITQAPPPRLTSPKPASPPPASPKATPVPSPTLFASARTVPPPDQRDLPPPPPSDPPQIAAPAPAKPRITIRLDQVLPMGIRSDNWFSCLVTVANRGDTELSVSNLFRGLVLKVTDASGVELARTVAAPLLSRTKPLLPKTQAAYRVSFGRSGPGAPIILPDTANLVRAQLHVTVSDNALTSNIIELDIVE